MRIARIFERERSKAPGLGILVPATGGSGGGTGKSSSRRGYETALARQLLAALPYEARAAARPHADVLAGLSNDLREALGEPPRTAAASDPVEQRARRQIALAAWVLALAKQRTLVVMVDDLQAADEESQALISALARTEPGHRLLLVCSVSSASSPADLPSVRGFSAAARKLPLSPLSAAEMRELLRSVFGEVAYLERLAARLHQISDGSPGHAWLLVRHLVRHGHIRYAEGAWALPTDLPADLPTTLQSSLIASLERLPREARQLARLAGLASHGALTSPGQASACVRRNSTTSTQPSRWMTHRSRTT